MGLAGIAAGALCGFALLRLGATYFPDLRTPDALPLTGSALILLAASVVASMLPALRAAQVDVIQALRTD
jgi:ABC-type antimicrobial peptide transport system permease subunit